MDEVRKQGCEGVTDLPEGFKMTELGPLPEEWEVIRLGDVARFETGKRERGGAQSQGEVFSVGGEHITEDGRLDFSSLKFISRRFYEKLNSGKVKPGDTLVCKDGARTGKSAFIREIPSSGLAVNEHVFIVRPVNAQLYDEFLGYWFLSEQAWQQLRVACHGLIGGITREDISNFILPLPPLYEQRAIAHVLRTVQRAKEATERVIQATRELKKSLMRYLFTYGPVSVEEAESVPLKETEIGLVPEHWEVVRLGEIGEVTAGGSAPQERYYFNGRHPFVRVQHLDEDGYWVRRWDLITDEAVQAYRLRFFPKGTIVLPKSGASIRLEKRAVLPVDAYIVSHLCAVIPNSKAVDQRYLFYALKVRKFSSEKVEGYPTLNLSEIRNALMPLPPLSEQRAIARVLRTVDKKLQAEEARKQALEALFKSLLNNLMTGKIRVKDVVLPNVGEGKGDVTH
ncbi:restriction endonuclease subunit S [Coprothermobacter proteolyticus]|uniref:restriction endonuclease subunit S n=1 Tax=Coprothermobacter proteolyticus TaxID=35786 RepID=UPI000D31146A|nr:restriction endonuclease subunit S [Coprothermobacter proteolyticus]